MADQDATDTDTVAVSDSTYVLDKTIVDTDDFRVYDYHPDAVWETGDEYLIRAPLNTNVTYHRVDGAL